MAEQSSTVVAFRALVMLVCLILIPVAAFCGSSFPAVVKAIQSGRWPTLADFRGPSGPSIQATEAPRFVPAPAPLLPPATALKTPGFPSPDAGFSPSRQGEMPRSQVVTAEYTTPINPFLPAGTGSSTSSAQLKDAAAGSSRGLSPVPPGAENLLSLDHAVVPARFDAASAGSIPGSSSNDELKHVLDRLRQLGATYFVLEPCGDEKREFRFYCRMSVGGNPGVTKPFWCFDGDPLKAITQVLKQVEQWQTGGK